MIDGQVLTASREQVMRLKSLYVGQSDLASRMSEMMWFDILVHDEVFGIDPIEVLEAVKEVEAGEITLHTKRATQFTREPLKGLWHKHYFSARFLPHNILLGLGNNGLRKIVTEELDATKSPVVTEEMLRAVAERVTREPLDARHEAGKITGEWIVFARHEGRNYYLCLATHSTGDDVVFDNIQKGCAREFPDLPLGLSR
jgi:hypothetical protein